MYADYVIWGMVSWVGQWMTCLMVRVKIPTCRGKCFGG